jgi:acetyltransferase
MASASGHLTLRDGHVLEVRPLEPSDREGFAAAVRGLSAQTRYLRFATPKTDLSERELDYLLDVDHHGHEAMLALDPATRCGVAVVRYVEIRGEPGSVEIAATVTDRWQGRGVGPALLARLVERAREEGYAKLRASVLASNRRSVRMLLRAGFGPVGRDGTLREYELRLESS